MTAERWRQIEELFQRATELPQSARQAFISESCNGDEELCHELESLLASDLPEEPLIEAPVLPPETISGAELAGADISGRRVGPYRLVRLVGHGGMGSVYLGVRDDDQYKKQVAIKLLKRGMDTEFMLRRFRQERQILANLEHPYIARLLDGGATDDGLPYFVMEFVEGAPVTQYCYDRNLGLTERLKLFRLICEAVQHAHQNLVVHRDIKPSNILTTAEGVPKLLDFGISKVVDRTTLEGTTLTQADLRMLTPDYASPEQVKGVPISTATDIYSLGAVLYELLTGQRPHRFTSNSLADMERTICETEPERPSIALEKSTAEPGLRRQRSRQVAGDLDNIVLKAMQKDPRRRYSTAAEFSGDIRRHLEGLPITARADTLIYRTGKFVRRNRLPVAAAALVFLSLLGGVVATTFQARRAERRFQIVRGLADSVLFDLHDQVQQLPGSTGVRAAMIETVLRYLDRLAADAGQDLGLQLEIAKAYHRVGAIEGHPHTANLGRAAAARVHYRKAIEMLQPLAEQSETHAAAINELVQVNIEAGDVELAAGDLERAKGHFRSAASLGDSGKLPLETEVTVYFRLGDIEAQQGAADAAAPHFRKALERAQKLAAADERPAAQRILRGAYTRLANASRESGALFACRDYLHKARQVVESTLRRNNRSVEDRRTLMSVTAQLAEVSDGPDDLNLGDYDNAIKYYREAVRLAEELSAEDRGDMRARRDLALTHRRLGRMLFETDAAEALSYYTKALATAEQLQALDPESVDFRRDVMEVNLGLGILDRKAGKKDALERLTHALKLQESIDAATPNRIWVTRYITQIHTEIGHALLASGDTGGALNSYRQALKAAEALLRRAPTSLYLARDRADVMEAIGRYYSAASARTGLAPAQRLEFKKEARLSFEKSLALWQDWRKRELAAPYAGEREKMAIAAIAALGPI